MPVSSDSNGVFTMVMQPARQGFASFARYGAAGTGTGIQADSPVSCFFDLVYSPEQAATWLPGVREALEGGSLAFYARAQVLLAGRYVVTARIADANGKAIALAQFNAEVAAGTAEFRLPLFGKLVRDSQPAFPLQLRDVEAFLLKPDTFPDRVMLPRLAGVQHTSKVYPLASFADAEWQSDERARYLAELGQGRGSALNRPFSGCSPEGKRACRRTPDNRRMSYQDPLWKMRHALAGVGLALLLSVFAAAVAGAALGDLFGGDYGTARGGVRVACCFTW